LLCNANIREAKNNKGQTALHLAVIKKHKDACAFLITKDSSLFMIKDNDGLMPIQYAAQNPQTEDDIKFLEWLFDQSTLLNDFSKNQEPFRDLYNVANEKSQHTL